MAEPLKRTTLDVSDDIVRAIEAACAVLDFRSVLERAHELGFVQADQPALPQKEGYYQLRYEDDEGGSLILFVYRTYDPDASGPRERCWFTVLGTAADICTSQWETGFESHGPN